MRASHYLLATVKETPADAVVISHQLMLRAGMIRKLASGLYTWLPTGLKVLRKVEKIVREEMDKSGALEVSMPVVQPIELWQESGRDTNYGPELLRFNDRHSNAFCLGPTHEEVITDLIRNEIQSYKQLPANFYQVQTKFRDEVRPRFGIMRAREFLMKDAYSFHLDAASLETTYQLMHRTYCAIFDRIGLDYRPVAADTGSIGGAKSHEFQVLAQSGEDDIAFSNNSDFAANVELVEALPPTTPRPAPAGDMRELATPNAKTIDDLKEQFGIAPDNTVKTLVVKGAEQPLVALLIRGDHTLNDIKAEKHPLVASPLTFASDQEIYNATQANAGSLGPVGLPLPILADRSVAVMGNFVCGANKNGVHLTQVNFERDLPLPDVADLRSVQEGDPSPDGKGTLTIKKGIEVGHIFQLGDKYSKALNATVLDENGKQVVMTMGCYGIGVSRIVAAAIEQNHDDKGIIWPDAIAPFQVVLVPLNYKKSERERAACDTLYQQLTANGLEVLYDDREKERLGVKLADAELIGIPHRLVITERGLDSGTVEYKARRDAEAQDIALSGVIAFLRDKMNTPTGQGMQASS